MTRENCRGDKMHKNSLDGRDRRMKIVCKDLKEYTMLVKQCMADFFADNCKCCVLRNLCVNIAEDDGYDIEAFLTIEGGGVDG